MRHRALKADSLSLCLILFFGVIGLATAQDTAPPPPPADAQSGSLQEPAPDNNVRAVRLSDVQGTVQILDDGETAFSQAQLNMPVVQGMRISTSEDGRAEIQFEDGSVARITPNSSITLTQLNRNSDGSTVTAIQADSGLTYFELNGRSGQYSVRFRQDKVVPIESTIFRIDLDSPSPELAVTHGSVNVSDDENLAANVQTNESMRFDPQNSSEYELLQSIAADSWDQWNSDRDEALAQLDESETEARASTGSPDNPAWSDLDANGDWYSVPGYGMGWSPSDVGQDWDPYGSGAWGYYSGIGYTWISNYSWGWWPYHCGAWSWFDGFGWMWFPGNCGWGGSGFGWYPYGVIWQVPPGYKCLRRPKRVLHNPKNGPVPHKPERLIAVNRGLQFTQQNRSPGVVKAVPRTFQYDGQNIAPVVASVHPHQGGPLGEGFTSSVERMTPGVMVRRAYDGPGYRPSSGLAYPTYQPSRGFTPPANHPSYSSGGHASAPASAPHASAPASSPHASAPASSPAASSTSGGRSHR